MTENKLQQIADEISKWDDDKEPLAQDHKLRFLPNALLLPHIGYVTAENYSIFYNQMIENLSACLKNKPIRVISK